MSSFQTRHAASLRRNHSRRKTQHAEVWLCRHVFRRPNDNFLRIQRAANQASNCHRKQKPRLAARFLLEEGITYRSFNMTDLYGKNLCNAGGYGRAAFGKNFSQPFDLCAHAAKFFFNALIATVNVVNAVENGFAFGNQGSNHQ